MQTLAETNEKLNKQFKRHMNEMDATIHNMEGDFIEKNNQVLEKIDARSPAQKTDFTERVGVTEEERPTAQNASRVPPPIQLQFQEL